MTVVPATDEAADLVGRLSYLLDRRVGVIRELCEVPRAAGAPDFFQYVGKACNTGAFTRQQNFQNVGGASSDANRAIGKAMGEAVERYCGAIYDIDDHEVVSRRNAVVDCVAPADFALYSAGQYREPGFQFVPFDDDTPVRWTPAYNAVTGQVQYIPAATVYIPYFYYQGSGESPVMEPISTGLSCGRSPLEATLGGVCEVVERDAFTLTWQAMLRPPVIDIDSLDAINLNLVERFRAVGLEVWLFDITTDLLVPSVMTVLRAESDERAAVVVAAATAVTAHEAVRKSLEELEHTRRYSQQIMDFLPRLEPDDDHDNVVSQIDHLNFWCDHANSALAGFLFENDEQIPLSRMCAPPGDDDRATLRWIVDHIADLGHHVLLADLTSEDVATAGLAVVRAVIPGLQPLYMGHRYRALGGSRLWTVPQRLGQEGITDRDNPSPHPFP
jgi:ribosomal protein S12 methylthiotransferase accessory factor